MRLFSSLYSGVGSVLIGSAPSSALFFTAYNLSKENVRLSREWQTHIVSAILGETVKHKFHLNEIFNELFSVHV